MNTNLADGPSTQPELVRLARDRKMAVAPDPQTRRMWALAYSAGSTLTGPVILGFIIDLIAGTMPWFMLGGVFLGMAGLTVVLIRMTKSSGPGQ